MGNVKPIPEGQHSVTPALVVKGAKKAIEFYKNAFGAKELGVSMGPDGQSVMHAELKIGDSKIYLGDEMPEMGAVSPQTLGGSPVSLNIYTEDCDAMFKKAIAAGAKVKMPLADMFWGDRYGKLEDPFGHNWGIATHKEDVSMPEMEKRMKEHSSRMAKK
jgi:PhnB protein